MFRQVSVGLPLYGGFYFLPRLVSALKLQSGVDIQLVVIETDPDGRSESYLRQSFSNLVYEKITKKDFSHSQTRQRISELATNDILIFITQDAVPASNLWALHHLETFERLPDLCAAVVGRQIPEIWAPLHQRRRIETTFNSIGGQYGITIFFSKSQDSVLGSDLSFLSNSNCSYRRLILVNHIPFPRVDYAEDQAIARALLKANYLLAYNPDASVIHTNKLSLLETFSATKAEIIGLNQAFDLVVNKRNLGFTYKYLLRNIFFNLRWILSSRTNLKYIRSIPSSLFFELQIVLADYSAYKFLRSRNF
jgi:rhamnosyltransferase